MRDDLRTPRTLQLQVPPRPAPKAASVAARAKALAGRCADAYSADRYGSWAAVAKALLLRGYTEREAEAIMRSKWTRWAGDASPARYGKVPAAALLRLIDSIPADRRKTEVAQLVAGTFWESGRAES